MTTYLRAAAVIAVVAFAGAASLYAFGSAPNVGSGPTSQPTFSQPPTASTVYADAPLGTFELDAFESRFDVEFSTEDLTQSSNTLYAADLDSSLGLGFIVDPNNAIVGTSIRSPLPDDNTATEDQWLAFVAETRPDAAEWLKSERDEYLAAPGGEVSLAESFGELCAGLVAAPPIFEPSRDATYLDMWVQYEDDCP
jgi:hypothetical protein